MVAKLARMQRDVRAREQELTEQMRRKSDLVARLKKSRATQLSELETLRHQHAELNDVLTYAFFERRGSLKSPVEGSLRREFGTFVDPQFRFRLMHKGLFYAAPRGTPVRAIAQGRVAMAARLPGYGQTVILDHGDNYYSVYAFSSESKVKEGGDVREGDLIALSGADSPLFGPGLYFEIRHFTDAIDPRPWIKESGIKIKTANTN
ncbi:MAG: M23 family metallopeptidase [Calothrix sp. SM1_5_4]|nr:M23 family metallopeptidase [Calothrix sp. SM1_5_4]